jgi:hypothetical protein
VLEGFGFGCRGDRLGVGQFESGFGYHGLSGVLEKNMKHNGSGGGEIRALGGPGA